MIEDKELRDLFKTEAGEHVQRLSDGLLRLEKEPKDSATLEEVFREAHSLKGAARMVGVVDVEEMAHKLEDMFGAVKKGAVTLTSEIIDSMFKTLDTIRKLVHEAVTGEKAGVRVLEVQPEAKIPPPPPFEKGGIGGFGEFKIETVRVDTKMLDALMTQTGELTVTKAHISSRIAEIDEIIEIVEELNKAATNSNSPSPPFNKGGNWGGLMPRNLLILPSESTSIAPYLSASVSCLKTIVTKAFFFS